MCIEYLWLLFYIERDEIIVFRFYNKYFYIFFMLFYNLLIICVYIVLIMLVIENEVKIEINNVFVVYCYFIWFIVCINKVCDFL